MQMGIYTVYKITNNLNNKIYIGAHYQKDNEDTYSYMGSGIQITRAIKKYGKNNFTKDILFIYDNREDMYAKEVELVNEDFYKNQNNYNMTIGGSGGYNPCSRAAQIGKFFKRNTKTNEWRWLGEEELNSDWVSPTKNKVVVKWADNRNDNVFTCDYDDPLLNSIYVSNNIGTFTAKDHDGNFIKIFKDDPRYLSGELAGGNKGRVVVKWADARNDEKFQVSIDDQRYLSGELISMTIGKIHSNETRKILSDKAKDRKGKYMWINNNETHERHKILKENGINFLKENANWKKGKGAWQKK